MPSPVALVRFGKAMAGTVVLACCMSLLPLGLPVLAPFLALPLAYLVVRGTAGSGAGSGGRGGRRTGVVRGRAGDGCVARVPARVGLGMIAGMGAASTAGGSRRTLAVVASGRCWSLWSLWGLLLWLGYGLSLTELRAERPSAPSTELRHDVREHGREPAATDGLASESVAAAGRHLAVPGPGAPGDGRDPVGGRCIGLGLPDLPAAPRQGRRSRMSLSGFRMHWALAYVSIVGLAMLLLRRAAMPAGTRSCSMRASTCCWSRRRCSSCRRLAVLRWFGGLARSVAAGLARVSVRLGGVWPGVLPAHGVGGAVRYVDRLSQAFRPQEPRAGPVEVTSEKE